MRKPLVKPQAADFDAAYSDSSGELTQLATDRMLAMAPPPFFASTGVNAWLMRMMPKKLASKIARRPIDGVGIEVAEGLGDAGVVDDQRHVAAAAAAAATGLVVGDVEHDRDDADCRCGRVAHVA